MKSSWHEIICEIRMKTFPLSWRHFNWSYSDQKGSKIKTRAKLCLKQTSWKTWTSFSTLGKNELISNLDQGESASESSVGSLFSTTSSSQATICLKWHFVWMLKDRSIGYMWLLTMQGSCIWDNMHIVILQVSFPDCVELAFHFYALFFYTTQYDLKNLLLFFSKLWLNSYALSQNSAFIPLMATIMVVKHSGRWLSFQDQHLVLSSFYCCSFILHTS